MWHFINTIDALAEKQSKKFNSTGINPNSNISENLSTITISKKVILDHEVRIIISDNAMGMIETFRNKISDPFFATQPIGSGSGTESRIIY